LGSERETGHETNYIAWYGDVKSPERLEFFNIRTHQIKFVSCDGGPRSRQDCIVQNGETLYCRTNIWLVGSWFYTARLTAESFRQGGPISWQIFHHCEFSMDPNESLMVEFDFPLPFFVYKNKFILQRCIQMPEDVPKPIQNKYKLGSLMQDNFSECEWISNRNSIIIQSPF